MLSGSYIAWCFKRRAHWAQIHPVAVYYLVANCFTSRSLSFLICKIGLMLNSQGYYEVSVWWRKCLVQCLAHSVHTHTSLCIKYHYSNGQMIPFMECWQYARHCSNALCVLTLLTLLKSLQVVVLSHFMARKLRYKTLSNPLKVTQLESNWIWK